MTRSVIHRFSRIALVFLVTVPKITFYINKTEKKEKAEIHQRRQSVSKCVVRVLLPRACGLAYFLNHPHLQSSFSEILNLPKSARICQEEIVFLTISRNVELTLALLAFIGSHAYCRLF